MTDDQIVKKFQDDMLSLVNSCVLPMSVKALVVENILLKANLALEKSVSESQDQSEEKE